MVLPLNIGSFTTEIDGVHILNQILRRKFKTSCRFWETRKPAFQMHDNMHKKTVFDVHKKDHVGHWHEGGLSGQCPLKTDFLHCLYLDALHAHIGIVRSPQLPVFFLLLLQNLASQRLHHLRAWHSLGSKSGRKNKFSCSWFILQRNQSRLFKKNYIFKLWQ